MKSLLILVAVTVFFAFISCKSSNDKMVTEKIEYDVLVNNPDSTLDYWIDNLEGPAREKMSSIIIEAALSGKYTLSGFEVDGVTGQLRHTSSITIDEIAKKLKPHPVKIAVQEGERARVEIREVMINDYNPANINTFKFLEEWKIDKQTLQISKVVKGIAPCINAFGDSSMFGGNKYFFFIQTDTSGQTGKFEMITERIQYDVSIVNSVPQADWWVNNIEKSYREDMINLILDKVRNGEVKAYDFLFNTELTPKEVNDVLAQSKVIQMQRPEPPYEMFDTVITEKMNASNLIRLRFVEEWEMSRTPFMMKKNVIGIAPIKENYAPDGSFRGYTPLFWIYFDTKFVVKNSK